MPQPNLTREIYDIVNRLEDKLDKRMVSMEIRVNTLESFRDNLMGKVAILTVVATTIISLMVAFIKDLFKT